MIANLPIEFKSLAEASGDFAAPWSIASIEANALCSIPREFDGAGGGFSPEDLFLHALINCFVGTFKVYTRASRIHFEKLSVGGKLTVDKNAEGRVAMTHCQLEIGVSGADRPDRIASLVAKAIKEGFILNSVKTKIDYQLQLEGAPHEQASQNGTERNA